jgi:hypothetical protein
MFYEKGNVTLVHVRKFRKGIFSHAVKINQIALL